MHFKNKKRIVALTKQHHEELEEGKKKYLSPKEWGTRFDNALSSIKFHFYLKEVEKLVKDRIEGKTKTPKSK